jgi:hypothetical protein
MLVIFSLGCLAAIVLTHGVTELMSAGLLGATAMVGQSTGWSETSNRCLGFGARSASARRLRPSRVSTPRGSATMISHASAVTGITSQSDRPGVFLLDAKRLTRRESSPTMLLLTGRLHTGGGFRSRLPLE